MSKYLAGDITEADLITHDADRLWTLGVDYIAGGCVTGIDRAARRVALATGESVAYDKLVLALGATPFRLPLPGADLPGVLMYRTLEEVRTMLEIATGGGSAIVIGGGLLGLEAAVGLAKRGMRVTVLHGVDRLMERQLDAPAAALLARRLERQGIATILSAKTVAIEGDAHVRAVRLASGEMIPADLVVMAVGIRPQTALARAAALDVDRAIIVDDALRTSDPAIFAIGECAQHRGVCIGLVAPALAQAEIAAANIGGQNATYIAEADATALKVAGAGVWSAGEIDTSQAEHIVYHDPDGGEYRKFLLRDDRLVGAMLYGETADAAWYHGLISSGAAISALRGTLPFGAAYAPSPAFLEAAE